MTNTMYNFLTRFDNREELNQYLKTSSKTSLYHTMLECTNYDWELGYRKTTKKMLTECFNLEFDRIEEKRMIQKEEEKRCM